MTEEEKRIAREKGELTKRRKWEERQLKKQREAEQQELIRQNVRERDKQYMEKALVLAKQAAAIGDVPIGCVIVQGDRIIAEGYNRRNADKTVLSHAEITAIQSACQALSDWRLEECTLYVTLEPCPMCAGAIVQARIPRVVIGSRNAKAGCAGSVLNVLQEPGFNHQAELVTGVLEAECTRVLTDFFENLRREKSAKDYE